MALHWRHVDFTAKRLLIRQGVVRGTITDLNTDSSWRDIDILPTVEKALRNLLEIRGYVFPNTEGEFPDLTNLRKRVWYPTLKAAGLRLHDLYVVTANLFPSSESCEVDCIGVCWGSFTPPREERRRCRSYAPSSIG